MQKLTLSTDDLPQHLDSWTRFKLWRDRNWDWVGATDLKPADDSPFMGHWEFAGVKDLVLAQFRGSMHSVKRTAQQISAFPQDNYFLTFNQSPTEYSFSQSGRDEMVTANRPVFFRGTETFASHGVRTWISIGIPNAVLQQFIPNADNLAASTLDGSSPALMHLRSYIGMLMGSDGIADSPALAEHVKTALCDLVALALGTSRDTAAIASLRGLRSARLAEILKEINSGFADPGFSVERVATKVSVSPSYIQKLLHETGASFTERVLELRLQKTRRMLADRRNDHLRIGDIALACGFNEISYFNRCFRRRFGDAPMALRGEGQ